MFTRSFKTAIATSVMLLLALPVVSSAQFGGILKRRLERAAAHQVATEIETLMREGVRCVFNDLRCAEQAKSEGKTPVMTDANGNVITDDGGKPITDPATAAAKVGAPDPTVAPPPAQPPAAPAAAAQPVAAPVAAGPAMKPGTGAWVNYDFVPGERVVFFDDFSGDNVGDFPRRFELLAGNWEVAEWNGARYLRATSNGTIGLELPETLPERFTVEFPASVQHGNAYVRLSTAPINHGSRDYAGSVVSMAYAQGGIRPVRGQGPNVSTRRRSGSDREAMVTLRVMADGDYMKVYLDDHRVANAPNAVFPRTNKLYFTVSSAADAHPIMIGAVRVAAGGLDLYDRLAADGRVSTQGVLFAVNSDVIRPESSPTLKAIGDMLTAHPELKLSIEGHTDSDGDDAANLSLSQRRAASVKTFLTSTYGISGDRLTTEGYGEGRPTGDNATLEGKAQNRRVELVKL
jgi:OOP family OmpA-OmpF porin